MKLCKILCIVCVLVFAGCCWMWVFFHHWYWLGFAGLSILSFIALNYIINFLKPFQDDSFNNH